MNCFYFYLNIFYFNLTFSCFYTITNFYSHSHHYYSDYSCYYRFCHCHCHYYFFIFNTFNFYFSSFYHSTLSLYIPIIFKFKTNGVFEHCSKLAIKDTETVSVYLMGTLNSVSLTYFSDNLLSK